MRFTGTAPQLLLNNSGAMTISNNISSIADLVIGGTGIGTTTLSGAITAHSNLTFNSSATLLFTSRLDVRKGLTVAGTGTFSLANGVLDGFGLITKSGTSTMIVNGSSGATQTFLGGYLITDGKVQSNSTASTAFRINPIQLTGTGTLAYGGTAATSIRTGEISGTGGIINTTLGTATNVGLVVHPLATATSAAALTTIGSNGLVMRGIATQIFTGDLSGLRGGISATSYRQAGGIYAGALRFQGSSVLSLGGAAATMTATGGQIIVDNSTTNILDRIASTVALDLRNGGTFTYIGHVDGGNEALGSLGTNAGATQLTIQQPDGATAATVLQFANSAAFNLRTDSATTVLFTSTGGTLGASGVNPRIVFTGIGAPFTGTGGLLATSSGGSTIGFAVVNNTRWAGWNATTGIVGLAYENGDASRADFTTGPDLVTAGEVVWFAPTATVTTLPSATSPAAIRIDAAQSGQSLSLGSFNLSTAGVLYTSATDFTITGTTGSITTGGSRYIWVSDPAGTLRLDVNLAASTAPINKTGDGWMEIVGSVNRLGYTSVVNTNILQGVMRSTLVALGGSNAPGSDGPFTTLNINGGTLEIDGGGSPATLIRALDLQGTTAGGGLRFQGGQAGFSAVNGDLTIALTANVGGTIATNLTWSNGSFMADGFALVFGSARATNLVDFTNAINLNDNTANTTYQPREIRVLDNPSSSGDYARLSGTISGTAHADLLKTGPGTLELGGLSDNSYAGGTLITEGTLLVSKSTGLGATGYILLGNRASSADASLLFNAVTPATLLVSNIYVPGDNTGVTTIGSILAAGQYEIDGNMDIRKNLFVRADNASTLFLNNTIIGTGSLTKIGTGTVALGDPNTFTGGAIVNAGTLKLADTQGLGLPGNVTLNAGRLDLANNSSSTFIANVTVAGAASITAGRTSAGTSSSSSHTLGTLSVGSQTVTFAPGEFVSSATLNFGTASLTGDTIFSVSDNTIVVLNSGSVAGGITDGGATRLLTKNGNGRLSLFGDNTSGITGTDTTWQLNAGIVQTSSVSRFGNNTVDIRFNGGTWNLSGVSIIPGSGRTFVFQAGGGTIDVNSDGSLPITSANQFSGSGSFTKTGLGPMSIASAQSGLIGPIFINGGSLQISNTSALGVPVVSSAITLGGGALGLITNSVTLPLTRPISVASSVSGSAIDVASGLTLTVPGGFSGVGPVNKTGDGKLVLSGVSAGSYSGAANVQAGTLAVNQSLNLTGGGSITVATTGTLGGSGTITGTASETISVNGVISPGNSIGTLTITGATNNWNDGSSVFFEFKTPGSSNASAGTNWDFLDLTGSQLTLSGTITLRIDALQSNGVDHATLASQNPFDPANGSYHMLFVRTAGVSGFTGSTFQIQDSVAGFGVFGTGNAYAPVGGQFWVTLEGNDLYVNYAAVPEPGSMALIAVATCSWAIARYRRRRKAAAQDSVAAVQTA
ncbi:MAG: autotransporter-associated beta strand repeat-containing protein [Pirellulales bacterium]